jgi:hypothetical protein
MAPLLGAIDRYAAIDKQKYWRTMVPKRGAINHTHLYLLFFNVKKCKEMWIDGTSYLDGWYNSYNAYMVSVSIDGTSRKHILSGV